MLAWLVQSVTPQLAKVLSTAGRPVKLGRGTSRSFECAWISHVLNIYWLSARVYGRAGRLGGLWLARLRADGDQIAEAPRGLDSSTRTGTRAPPASLHLRKVADTPHACCP